MPSWVDPSPHTQRFVETNGVRLECLDWGGDGPPLVLLHGGGDNPHAFDDLAPRLTGRFRVISYARRGHGRSEARPPYDMATLTEDLVGVLDAFGIERADFAGWSFGAREMTALAGEHPERVRRAVYLDGAYDWDGIMPRLREIQGRLHDAAEAALASWDAYLAYQLATAYVGIDDPARVEPYLRESVIERPDGSLRSVFTDDVRRQITQHFDATSRLEYAKVQVSALAIYAESFFDLNVADLDRRALVTAWERAWMAPARETGIERFRREMADGQTLAVPGSHVNFLVNSAEVVVAALERFLL